VSRRSESLALAAAYAALSVLVAAGALSGVDQWSVDHLMPGRPGIKPGSTIAEAVVPLLHASWSPALDVVGNVVTLPAQVVIASLLAGACCLMLWRRGRQRAAIAWGAAWAAGNAIEVLCKSTLTRPQLYAGSHALVGLHSSYPSGHTLRSVLLAAMVATIWPASRPWVVLWAATTLALLELDGFHVPSDIAGGLLLAVLLILLSSSSSWPSRPSSSSSSSSCSSVSRRRSTTRRRP
jgi:membrane-associated phospholipid phosphatase